MYERLKQLIEANGITVSALEKACGFGNGSIRKWESQNPSIDKVYEVANYLNVSLDYLYTGKNPMPEVGIDISFLKLESSYEKTTYLKKVLSLKDDTIFTRFKEARIASGFTVEEAAGSAYLDVEELLNLENDDLSSDYKEQMKKVKEIDLMQFAALAYKYDVDLYWLLGGQVRPPAAVVQDGTLAYPPYEFMISAVKEEQQVTQPPENCPTTSIEEELLLLFQSLDSKGKRFVMKIVEDYVTSHSNLSHSHKKDGTKGGNIA